MVFFRSTFRARLGSIVGLGGLACLMGATIPACGEPAEEPAHAAVIHLRGTPYERGMQHGKQFSNRIRSMYAGILTNSILPYLNRERPDIASFLTRYKDPRYDNNFSHLLMLESAQHMEQFIPPEYLEEMRGIADGSGVSYEEILILNTFMDTMLGFRGMTFFIRKLQAPSIVRLEFEGGIEADGWDNNGNGEVDEPGEAVVTPYDPTPHAVMAEVPTDGTVKIIMKDSALMAIPEGVDPGSIRIQLDKDIYEAGDPSIQTREFVEDNTLMLEVAFKPPGGFPASKVVALLLQAADKAWVEDPPPAHARVMRDERFVFSTVGTGLSTHEMENRGEEDGRTQPPSLSFAVRGTATPDGMPLLAHHYALLDSNTSHKHTVFFKMEPNEGKPHVVLGWTGVVGGFAGMNADGLSVGINNSDSLDNAMAANVKASIFEASLVMAGVPVAMMTRELLTHHSTTQEAAAYLQGIRRTYGWNVLLADAGADLMAVEVDGHSFEDADGGYYSYTPDASVPDNLDAYGRPWASVGPDDIRMASHYARNVEDVRSMVMSWEVVPQRYWTSFYYRSLRAHFVLGEQLAGRYGTIDAEVAKEILRTPQLVDERDSMSAAIFRPAERRLFYALGTMPATDGSFHEVDLGAVFGGAP
jgi:hypothetical protein